jgi:alkyl hydroperoxide reductase subunit AhpF
MARAPELIAARAIIVATGITWRRLGVPRLEALVGVPLRRRHG